MLFVPKGFKGFDKSKMKQFDKKKSIKKEYIDQEKIGPIILDGEKVTKMGKK